MLICSDKATVHKMCDFMCRFLATFHRNNKAEFRRSEQPFTKLDRITVFNPTEGIFLFHIFTLLPFHRLSNFLFTEQIDTRNIPLQGILE